MSPRARPASKMLAPRPPPSPRGGDGVRKIEAAYDSKIKTKHQSSSVDHALEMWREGWAMGDGSRNKDNLLTGCMCMHHAGAEFS